MDFNTIIAFLTEQIQNNNMFVAIIGGMLFGSVLYILRAVPAKLWRLFLLQCTVEMVIYNDNSDYYDILAYLNNNNLISHSMRRLTIDNTISIRKNIFYRKKTNPFENEGEMDAAISLGVGYHFIKYKGKHYLLHHDIGEAKMKERPKTITIRCLGRTNHKMKKLIDDAIESKDEHLKDSILMHVYRNESWMTMGSQNKRPIESVVIDKHQKQNILDDIVWFMQSKDWYNDRGIPYRRGYMFYGPPGTGKTSLVLSIASYFNLDIYILNLSTVANDTSLMEAFSSITPGSILLIEDIDAAGVNVSKRETKKDKNDNEEEDYGITLSGLMNALDGISSPEDIMIFMTTNYPEKIDNALIRPGRVDRKELITYPGANEIHQMVNRFFDDEELADQFVEGYNETGQQMTPAELQGLFLQCQNDPYCILDYITMDKL